MAKVVRESWLAVVQHGDEETDQETELVTLEFRDAEPSRIDLTDGTSITLVQPAASLVPDAAAAA